MWSPQHNAPSKLTRFIRRIARNLKSLSQSRPQFLRYQLLPFHNHTFWSLRTLITLIALTIIIRTIHLIYGHPRYTPQRVNYSAFEKLQSLDDKLQQGNLKSFPLSNRPFGSKFDDVFQYGCRDPLAEANNNDRANAAFVVLARNTEIDGVILSMRSLERRFNPWFNYPWIFLNDEPFTPEFKKRVAEVASGDFHFGVIPKDKWSFKEQQTPKSDIDSIFFNEAIENQGDRGIMYGNMHSYHSMCRFYSGFFFEHELVKNLDWYWRVEPEVDFYCDLTYDPFVEMEKHNKKYGYTIIIKELLDTVPSLFKYTQNFIKENNINLPNSWRLLANNHKFFKGDNENLYVNNNLSLDDFFQKLEYYAKLNYANNHPNEKYSIDFIVKNALPSHENSGKLIEKFNNESFNLCHFWSNFEIASNSLFSSPKYKAYYEYLENSRGFYTERWGDAPVHSLAVAMFLDLSEIHYFRDIGYKHSTIAHCPFNAPQENQPKYVPGPKFKHQVLPQDELLYASPDPPLSDPRAGAPGCRCRCPSDHEEIENSQGSCSALWMKLTSDELYNDQSTDHPLAAGLGVTHYLDLNTLEDLAINSLTKWLQDGRKWDKWSLSKTERKELLNFVVSP